jgi:hypothetical protein
LLKNYALNHKLSWPYKVTNKWDLSTRRATNTYLVW